MTNHAIIGQAFSILREQLAPYVVQKIMQIPDYKGNDLWWTEGIMSMLSDRERSDLYYGDDFAQRLKYYPTTTREPSPFMGRITDNLTSGKVLSDLGLPPIDPAQDRAMICGSLAFNVDVKAVLEGFGLNEGANSEPREFVVEKAFVGDGV